jgi:hypothetical protein
MKTVPFLLTLLFPLAFHPHAATAQPGPRPLQGESLKGIGPENDPTRQDDSHWMSDQWQRTDVGPFLGATIATPHRHTFKGIAIKVGEQNEGTVCFDLDLLRYSAAWSGGFLKFQPQRFGLIVPPQIEGSIAYVNLPGPGWADSAGLLPDLRPAASGPLPRDWARYRGLYRHGKRVVLSYTVGKVSVLESPWIESGAFTRVFEIEKADKAMRLLVAARPGAASAAVQSHGDKSVGTLEKEGEVTAAILLGDGATIEVEKERLLISLPPSDRKRAFKVLVWSGKTKALPEFVSLARASSGPEPLAPMLHGGPTRWNEPLVTRGQVGSGKGAFAIDTLNLPFDNPWNALFFVSGHDFFPNGDIALSTIHGDVWRVSGLDEKLEKLTWKRYATGLHQPLGLRIVDGRVHVIERDRITVLHDLDGDHEADFYENFNSDCISLGGGHSYATCLETDPAGNFYFLKCAEATPHGGTLLRVSSDGARLDVVATGFRNPNGLGVSPAGLITAADQQGEWVPETRLDAVRDGGFYGYMPMHHREKEPESYDPPLCWIPRIIDNSAGGQAWVPEGQWGPFSGKMIHLSYGRCTFMAVLIDELSGAQGAIVPLPGRFASGVMRARFSPADRHLYVSGMRGWQTAALLDGCLQRVRYTGEEMQVPAGFAIHQNGVQITFSHALDKIAAEDPDNYGLEQWNYRWTSAYGSPDYSPSRPESKGRDPVPVKSARLLPDGRSVFLETDPLAPVMQFAIRYALDTAEGELFDGALYTTINRAGAAFGHE